MASSSHTVLNLWTGLATPGLGCKLDYLRWTAFPSREYVRWRYGALGDHPLLPYYLLRLGRGLVKLFG